MNISFLKKLLFTAAAFPALMAIQSAFAATYDWTGTTNGNMSGTTANWGGTVPTSTDIARWNAATYTNAPTANGNMTIGELLFDAGNTAGVTFGAGTSTLTLNGISGVGLQMNSGSGAVNTGSAKFSIGAAQSWTNNSASALTVGGAVALGANILTLNGTGAVSLGGIISGTGGLSISNGTVTLSGTNTFTTGGLTLNSGTLNLNAAAAIGGSGSRLIINGGSIDTTNATATQTGNRPIIIGGNFSFVGTSDLNLGTGAVTLTGNRQITTTANALTLGGVIADNGGSYALTKSGAGTLTLSGANTFMGGLNVAQGTVKVGATAALGGGLVTIGSVGNSTTLDLNGASRDIKALASAGTVTNQTIGNSAGTAATLNYNGATTSTFGGVIQDVVGAGTSTTALTLNNSLANLTLIGTNTYTGATTVTLGQLNVTGTGSTAAGSAVNVTGGLIGGNGTFNGAVTVSGTGGINLGNGAIETLTLGSTLNITGSAGANNLKFDLASGGSTTDKITVAGATTVTNAGAAVINLNQIGGIANPITAGAYTLIQGTGSMDVLAKFALGTTKAFGQTYSLSVVNGVTNDLQVTTAVGTAGPAAAFWAGGATSWSTAANWKNDATSNIAAGAAPGFATNVTFYTTSPVAANLSNTVDVDFDINSLNFSSAATSAVTIATGSKMLTIEATNANGNTAGTGITVATPSSGTPVHTISGKVGLASSQTWNIQTGAALTVSAIVGDFGGGYVLTKDGAGLLTLSGANDFSGGLAIKGGTAVGGGNGAFGTGAISLGVAGSSNNVILRSSTGTQNNAINLNATHSGSATIEGGNSGTATLGGLIALNGHDVTLQQTGGNTFTLGGGVTGAGNVTLNVTGTQTMTLSGATAVNPTGSITNSGAGSGGMTINANLGPSVTGLIQNSKTSALTIGAINNSAFTGSVTINAGILTANGGTGVTNQLGSGAILLGATSGTDDATLVLGNAGQAPTLSNALTVRAGSSGTLKLYYNSTSGGATYSGPIALNNNLTIGTATTGGGFSITGSISGTGNLVLDNRSTSQQFNLTGASINNVGTITNSGATGTIYTNLAAAIGANVTAITQNGATGLSLAGNNSAFTGTVNVTSGTLQLSNGNALNVSHTVTMGAGSILELSNFISGVTLAGINGVSARSVAVTTTSNPSTLTLGGSGTYSTGADFTNVSAAALSLIKTGTGTQTLTGKGYNTGTTAVNNGTLIVTGDAGTLAATSGLAATTNSVSNPSMITGIASTSGLVIGQTVTGTGVGVGARITDILNGTTILVSANSTASGTISDLGFGSLNYGGAGEGTGGITTSGTGSFQLGNGGTTGSLRTTQSITNNGNFTVNRSNAVVQGTDFTASAINGTGSFTQAGSGTTTLNAANGYSGVTTVSAGTLLISGSGTINATSSVAVNGGSFVYDSSVALSRNVTVNGGAFRQNSAANYTGSLSFTSGTVGGSNLAGVTLSIGTGKTMAPGNSTGTLAAGATTWTDGGTFQFELNDATGTAGSTSAGWDLLNSTTLGITAGIGQFTLQIVSLDSLQAAGLAQNFVSTNSYNWLFADAGSTISTFNANQFVFNLGAFQNAYTGTFGIARGDAFGIGGDDSQLFITYTAIPEPSTWALLAAGLTVVVTFRRRRS